MDKFCITFAGELKDGWSREKVTSELGKLFRVDPEHLRKKIFTDSAVVLKKNISFEEAQKYKTAMSERGAIVTISKEAIPSVQNTSKQIEFKSIEAKLAEPGVLLIDYKTVEPANYDTSKFSLSEVGAILTEPVSIEAPQYDFSKFIVKKMDE